MTLDVVLGLAVAKRACRELAIAVSAESAHLLSRLHLVMHLELDDGRCSLVL